MELSNTTHERNSEDVSHLDIGGGNSAATGQIEVLDRDTNHALTVRAAFAPVREMAEGWLIKARAINVTSIEQVEEMTLARESRIGLSKVSGAIDRWHKEHKAEALARGREIDDIARDLKDIVTAARDMCRHQEEFAKRHEEARLAALRAERHALLIQHGANPGDYTDLATISEDGWNALYAKVVRAAELEAAAKAEATRLAEVARVEAERAAAAAQEAERLERVRLDAERLERERLQAEENARLKAERAAADEALRLEREERERQDAIREEALRIEREAAAAIAREKAEAARKVEAALRIEREAREKAEREAAAERRRVAAEKEAREREEREKAEALAEAARQAALAPDREKLLGLAGLLLALANGQEVTVRLPTFSTPEGIESGAKVRDQIAKLAAGTRRLGGAK